MVYNDNKFGANGFYGVKYPNQWEHTTTKYLNTVAEFGNENFSISPKVYWRRNDDNYLLDYEKPEIYQNIHQTNVYGTELQSSVNSGIGTTSLGGEFVNDEIKSSNLGIHSRNKKGIFAEQKISTIKNFTIITGAFLYNYSGLGWKFWPGLDLGYSFSNGIRIYGSAGKAFRIPTYTELYYSSPISQGSSNLKPEETLNYEAGINLIRNKYSVKICLFRKEGKNLIDWVRTNSEPWTAKNIAEVNTNGLEINLSISPNLIITNLPVYKISADYTYLNSDKKTASYESEYLLDFLRNQFILNIDNYWWLDIQQSWFLRYEDRVNFEDNFIVDSQLSKEVENFN